MLKKIAAVVIALAPAWAGAADPNAATAEEVIAKVQEAAQYLHDKGQAGFPDFNNNARWVWKDSYVFVFSCRDNKMIAHPLRPDLIGRPILQMQDDKGNHLFQALCVASDKAGGGWVEYLWPKPGEGNASRKITYALKTSVSFQPDVREAAGIYEANTTVEQLNKMAAQSSGVRKDAP